MSSSRSCASVCDVGKWAVFTMNFTTGSFLIQKGSKLDVFHNDLEPLSFIRELLGKMKSGCLKHKGKGVRNLGAPLPAAHPLFLTRTFPRESVCLAPALAARHPTYTISLCLPWNGITSAGLACVLSTSSVTAGSAVIINSNSVADGDPLTRITASASHLCLLECLCPVISGRTVHHDLVRFLCSTGVLRS